MMNKKWSQPDRRRGATLFEVAVIYPIAVLLTVGLMIFGLGVSRYNQIAGLAREGARWASVHGAQFAFDYPAKTMATPGTIRDYLVDNKISALDPDSLIVNATWSPNNNEKGTEVTVTVSYAWLPEAYWGSVTFSSTSRAIISY